VERDPVVSVAGHARHVGRFQLPGEQRGGAENMPQAMPRPPAIAVAIAPPGRQVSALEDIALEVRGPPVLPRRRRKDQPERVEADGPLSASLLDPHGEPFSERVTSRRAARIDSPAELPVL